MLFAKAMSNLMVANVKNLMIDLRGNGGRYFDTTMVIVLLLLILKGSNTCQ